MTTYVLEMRSTANWQDVRYREYTTSAKKAEIFKGVPRISFTDSGHGIVPAVREHYKGPREPRNMMLADHVQDYIKAEGSKPKRPAAEHLTVQILKDVFDGIEHFYGKEGLDAVAGFARLANRSRESNKLIDELEAQFPTLTPPERAE